MVILAFWADHKPESKCVLKCFTGAGQRPAAALKHSVQFALKGGYYCLKEAFPSKGKGEQMSQSTHSFPSQSLPSFLQLPTPGFLAHNISPVNSLQNITAQNSCLTLLALSALCISDLNWKPLSCSGSYFIFWFNFSPQWHQLLTIIISHSQSSCGVFSIAYLECLSLSTSPTLSLIWSLPEIHPHHTVIILLPVSTSFLSGNKKKATEGYLVQGSYREGSLQGGMSYQDFLEQSATIRAPEWNAVSPKGRAAHADLWL